jgi:hypothetical protein
MKTKIILTFSAFVIFATTIKAQVTEAEKELRTQKNDTILGWRTGGTINLGLAQTSLTNWAAGGQSSVAVNGLLILFANKTMHKALWENSLDFGYGILKQGTNANWQKTDDRINFSSKLGRKLSKKWYFAGLLNFRTQMTAGYNYPNDSVKISNFMAPGYLLAALGFEYRPNEHFSAFIAPLTSKATFVNDKRLANAGAFGVEKAVYSADGVTIVEPGKNFRTEFGGYVRIAYRKEILKNVGFQTGLDLFSNYLHNPQNIDVNWDMLITLKVNKFISATVGTSLIYDDDVRIGVDTNNDGIADTFGPRVQFREILTAGLTYKFL